MHVSEAFPKFIASVLLVVLAVAVIIGVSSWLPPNHVQAQSAGTVGIYTKQITVFTAQTTSTSSAIFPDFGFGANFLSFTTTNFTGTIDLEWSPTPSGPFFTLAKASFVTDTTGTGVAHVLQLGGYWPNLRSTVSMSAGGSISAWYTANAGPISFFPAALGSNGPSTPIACDQTAPPSTVTNGSYLSLVGTNGRGVAVCRFTISFLGATTSATSGVQVGYGTPCNSAATFPWVLATTSGTPQIVSIGDSLGALFQVAANPTQICIGNNSGASLEISLSYASL